MVRALRVCRVFSSCSRSFTIEQTGGSHAWTERDCNSSQSGADEMAEKTTAGRYYESVCNVTDGVERLGASSSSQLQESVAHDFQFSVDALRVGLMHNQFLLSNGMTGQSTNRSDPSSVAATPNYGVHSSSTESWSFASESTRRRLGHLSGLRVSLARREQTLSQGVVEKTLSLCIVSVDPSKEAEWLACTEGVLPDCPKWILPGMARLPCTCRNATLTKK